MKKIRAIAFDTAQEINTLVLVLSTYIHDNGQSNTVKKLLSTAREVQKMFIDSAYKKKEEFENG
jgi:hypothetical protein